MTRLRCLNLIDDYLLKESDIIGCQAANDLERCRKAINRAGVSALVVRTFK